MNLEVAEEQPMPATEHEHTEIDDVVSEHVLELRYKPDANVLDYRGQLATAISNYVKLTEWRITQNRIDVYNKGASARVFASFRNAGVVVRNPTDADSFPNLASKFVQFLAGQRPFRKKFSLLRLGVRSRFGYASGHSFQELVERYLQRVVEIRPGFIDQIGATPVDVGVPVNFEASSGHINSNSGPMEREQLSGFFSFHPKVRLPDVAFYIEFDYWIRPEKETSVPEIVTLLRDYAGQNWENSEKIRDLVMGD